MQTRDAIFQVRPLTRSDISDVVKLQRKAGALYMPWSPGQLESHLRNFPEGQLVVVDAQGALVGSASSLSIVSAEGEDPGDWLPVTGNGYFHTHTKSGNTLYVASVSIAPEADRAAVWQTLGDALLALVAELGLARMLTSCRLPGYEQVATKLTPEEYLASFNDGKLVEPALAFHMSHGFKPLGLLPDLQNQPRTKERLATLLEWRAGAA